MVNNKQVIQHAPNSLVLSKRNRTKGQKLTLMGTEAIFGVVVEVVGGGAPQEAIVPALWRAGVVLFTLEQERELAELPVCVAELDLHHCQEIRITWKGGRGGTSGRSREGWNVRSE